MKVLIPMAGLIDKEAELQRLAKEIARMQSDVERARTKLANPSFVDKAPPAVVQKERNKIAEQEAALAKMREQENKISAW
jgi:valyl-tRNA synthetase